MKMYLGKKQTSATSRSKKAPKMEMKLLNSSRRLKVFKSAAKGESFAGEKASLRTSKSPRLQLLEKVRVRDGKLSEGRKSVAAREAKSGYRSRSFDVEGRRADYSDAKSKKVKKEKRLEEVRVRDGKLSEGRKPVAAREAESGYRSRSFDVEGRRADYSDAKSKKVKKEKRLEEVRVRDGKLSEGRKPVAAREAESGYRSRSFDVEGRRADDSDAKSKKVKKEKRLEATVEDENPSRKEARNSFSESAKKKSSKREASKLERGEEASGIGTKSSNGGGKTSGLGEKSKNGIADAEVPKKRKKRVIRIDPYDISNKRLYDGLSAPIEKVPEEEITLSQNAQFRAIKPSREILTCVEDNLLGRRRLIELRKAGYNIDISAPLDNIPFSTSAERERIEDNVFRNKLAFFAAAKVSSSFPPPSLPEIAFAGRSNVGKSSLLNALTRQWGVVRTSDKPGLTQTINFFKLGPKLCLVDLPGYGFAYAKEEVKDAWEELVKEYVSTRVGLRRVCLLVDTKWGMKPRDHELVNLMERSQTQYQIVLTKTDTVFPIDVARRAMQIQEGLRKNKSIVQPVMMVSSISGAGIRCLRTVLSKIGRVVKI